LLKCLEKENKVKIFEEKWCNKFEKNPIFPKAKQTLNRGCPPPPKCNFCKEKIFCY